jgi:hypothetical protein
MERTITLADLIMIAGTRVALGFGIGLLVAGRLNRDERKAAGIALAVIGGATTIPIAMGKIGKKPSRTESFERAA